MVRLKIGKKLKTEFCKMSATYHDIGISNAQASDIARELYKIKGIAKALAGEVDFNFRIDADRKYFEGMWPLIFLLCNFSLNK